MYGVTRGWSCAFDAALWDFGAVRMTTTPARRPTAPAMKPIVEIVPIVWKLSTSDCLSDGHVPLGHASFRSECFPSARSPVTAPTASPAPPTPRATQPIVFCDDLLDTPVSALLIESGGGVVAPGVVAGTAATSGAAADFFIAIGTFAAPPSATMNFVSVLSQPSAVTLTTW